MENIFGYIAGFCTTIAFIPQVILIIKTKDTRSISLGMYFLYCFGIASWLTYGLQKNDAAMIISNIVTLSLASVVLSYKIRNHKTDTIKRQVKAGKTP